MSEWVETTLGEVTLQVRDVVKMEADREYRLLGLRMYGRGVYLRETVDSISSKASQFYRASAGQFVYNRMFAWGGSFGVVPPSLDGTFVSNEFPLFESDPSRLSIGFLRLYFQQPSVWDAINAASTGTTKSRNRWKENLFQAHRTLLPSLPEQRRIVDVMAAVDAQIEALAWEVGRLDVFRDALAEEILESLNAPRRPLGEALQIVRGGSPRPIDDYFTEEPDGLNWVKIGDVPNDGKYVTQTKQKIKPSGLGKTRYIEAGSFILSNSMSFGRPYIMAIDGCIHDGWLALTDTEGLYNQDFLYYLLRSRGVQAQFSALAAGSGVRNLNIKSVSSVEASVPDIATQLRVVAQLDALLLASRALHAEVGHLRTFRSTLLTSLLNQNIEIPESYDDILEVAS